MASAAWHFNQTTKLAGILNDYFNVVLYVTVISFYSD